MKKILVLISLLASMIASAYANPEMFIKRQDGRCYRIDEVTEVVRSMSCAEYPDEAQAQTMAETAKARTEQQLFEDESNEDYRVRLKRYRRLVDDYVLRTSEQMI